MDRSLAAAHGAGRRALTRGTTRRFLLLLCVLLVACLAMFSTMSIALRPGTFEQCVRVAATADLDGLLRQAIEDHERFRECRSQVTTAVGRDASLATGAVVVTGLLCYWWLPAWRTRRRRLLPAGAFDRPSPRPGPAPGRPPVPGAVPLTEQLAQLSERAGLSRHPGFVVDPQAMTAGAVAFGRAGRYTVCLHSGLIPRRFTDPAGFEAVVLHELAHIRNRDVDLAYLTVILWRVLLVAALLPHLALLGWRWLSDAGALTWANSTPSTGKVGFALLVAGQAYLARAEVLRYRELCADLDAVRHGADPAGWDSPQLAGAPGGPATRRHRPLVAVARWFAGPWRSHPSWQRRHRLLTGADPIWPGATGTQLLLIGVAATILLYPWWGNLAWPAWLFATIGYTVGPLLAIVLLIDLPEKRPPSPFRMKSGLDPLYAPATPVRSERRTVWSLAAAAVLIGALFVVDPLGGYRGDGVALGAGLTAPPEYRPRPVGFPRSFPTVPETSAEVTSWLAAGGRRASIRLYQVATSPPGPTRSGPDGAVSHCAAATAAVAEAQATAAPPVAGRSWQVLVLFTRLGSEAGCLGGSGGRSLDHPDHPDYRDHPAAARYYAIARDAYQQFAWSVLRYAPGSVPLQ